MRALSTERLPDSETIATASWRVGVFITLAVLTLLTFAMANQIFPDVPPEAAQALSWAVEAGHILMVFSLIVSVAAYLLETSRGVEE